MSIPTRIAVFLIVQLLASLFAIHKGGEPERLVAWMMVAAAIAGAVVIRAFGLPRHHDSLSLFAVDAAFLAGMITLALFANRFWPMWIAALQLVAMAFHVVRQLEPGILQPVYNQALGKIAYPMILLLIIGTIRHRQRSATEPDRAWSPIRW